MAPLLGKVETSIKVITKMTKEMALVRCIGQTDLSMKVNGKRESSMEEEK
jgi:hypothetical protein